MSIICVVFDVGLALYNSYRSRTWGFIEIGTTGIVFRKAISPINENRHVYVYMCVFLICIYNSHVICMLIKVTRTRFTPSSGVLPQTFEKA